jgi:hypothetical protein
MNEKEPSALVVFQQARASKQRATLREASQASKLKRPIGKLQNDYDVKGQPNARRHYIGARGQVGSRAHWSKERGGPDSGTEPYMALLAFSLALLDSVKLHIFS